MLIKEFRTPLPMSVDEYRVAQLYCIQKMSRLNTKSQNEGIQFLINEPYTNGPGGQGQYTKKAYYIHKKLPNWLQLLIPKDVAVIEEAWNAYPYSKTVYHLSLFERALIEMETHFLPDNGCSKDVFCWQNLKEEGCVLDSQLIDICNVKLASEPPTIDPRQFFSEKTGRGPLKEADWIQNCQPIMCSYKLVKIDFPYFLLQTQVEKFLMNRLVAQLYDIHASVWVWQDEWYGLTMDDIREIEKKAQEELANVAKSNNT